jgi:hypothetical protein
MVRMMPIMYEASKGVNAYVASEGDDDDSGQIAISRIIAHDDSRSGFPNFTSHQGVELHPPYFTALHRSCPLQARCTIPGPQARGLCLGPWRDNRHRARCRERVGEADLR